MRGTPGVRNSAQRLSALLVIVAGEHFALGAEPILSLGAGHASALLVKLISALANLPLEIDRGGSRSSPVGAGCGRGSRLRHGDNLLIGCGIASGSGSWHLQQLLTDTVH